MKKSALLLSLFLSLFYVKAQDYKISFNGKGASETVDSVKVENLTQGKRISLSGSDVLHLTGTSTGINPMPEIDNTLRIYPNPSTESSRIEFVAKASGITNIELFDIIGKRVASVKNNLTVGTHSFVVSGLRSGIYTIRVHSQTYNYTGKLVSNSASGSGVSVTYLGLDNDPVAITSMNLKGTNAEKIMQYTTGDILKIVGKSVNNSTVVMDVPTQSKTIAFTFVDCTDGDGNNYSVVQIGTQTWMAENLKTTKYNDNTFVPLITDNVTWSMLTTPGYCWYNNDPTTNKNTYGGLYNWHSVNTSKLAPTGWHVPTDAEWTTLATYLGAVNVVGGYLKETGLTHWQSPNTRATNEIGFTALPGGYRIGDGTFIYIGYDGSWWSSTLNIQTSAWNRSILYNSSSLDQAFSDKISGFSVRCVMNEAPIAFSCGSSFTINHSVSGGVAPIAKTVTYGTVTNIPGETSKCWITSNLGADHQATAVDDATEASAGWYWQFNRKQGYKHDGTTRTPNSGWINSFSEGSDWITANDPCAIELGSGWRIPTYTEWTNVDVSGGWTDKNGPWNSGLKLHAAGYQADSDGTLNYKGINGVYWSGTQNSTFGWNLLFHNTISHMGYSNKAGGFSLRCIKEAVSSSTIPTVTTTAVTSITQTTATGGGYVISDGGAAITARGVCWSKSPNPTSANDKTTDGNGTGTFISSIASLTQNTPYYVRAYATNSVGTAYGNEVSFTTLAGGSACGSPITINHVAGVVAPVSKTVTYGTVTNIPGEPSKCWITSNLGASQQATTVNDATEASAGWYWQFNRKQGYKHDGTTRTPNSTWISNISESSDWTATNDPCATELGSGWRIPTNTEWTNVDASGSWTDLNHPWNSGLKLHTAGRLYNGDGSLGFKGEYGYYWSSKQYSDEGGMSLNFGSGLSNMSSSNKSVGYTLRCIKDVATSKSTILVDTLINASAADVIITVLNKIKVVIPKGTVLSNRRLTIEEEPTSNYPEDEIFKTHFIYNVRIAGQTTFNEPLIITFNYNPANLETGWTKDRLGASYYNDSIKTWITYPDAVVDSVLNQIAFMTNHLTPLSFAELLWTGYQHKFENEHFIVYYTYEGSNKVCDNTTYDSQSQPWHITEGPEKATPFYIQDLAHWLCDSWVAYDGMGFSFPKEKIKVYVRNLDASYGEIGSITGKFFISNDVNLDTDSNPKFTRSNLLQGTVAHEMLHLIQSSYNTMITASRWWLEALATQGDRMVWGNALERYETEFYCNKVTNALGYVLCHSLAFSWDKAINWDWYAAGGFLAYLSNYRIGTKLNLFEAVIAGSEASSRDYIDNEIKTNMGGTGIGNEYLNYLQWLYEKRHDRQQLPTVQYSPDNPMVLDATLTTTNNSKKCSELSMPYLSARLIKIKNNNIKTDTEFEITISKPDPAIRIFLYKYQDMKMQVLAELNDMEKRSLTIPEKNIYDILIVNTSKDNSLPFEVTIAQKVILPAGMASLGSPQFFPIAINKQTSYNMSTIKSTSISDGSISIEQRGNSDGIVWGTLKITWNQPPGGNYIVYKDAVFWTLNLKFEFETIGNYSSIGNPTINITGLSGSSQGSSGSYDDWNNGIEPNFCLALAPDNIPVLAGSAKKYSITKSYNITLRLDCGGAASGYDGDITFPIRINNYFDEDISVVLKYYYLRE